MADSFRMDTSGDKAYREAELEAAMDRFDEQTKSGAVMSALDFAAVMERALKRASEHEDMTEDLAGVLSTSHFRVVHEIERDLETPRD